MWYVKEESINYKLLSGKDIIMFCQKYTIEIEIITVNIKLRYWLHLEKWEMI